MHPIATETARTPSSAPAPSHLPDGHVEPVPHVDRRDLQQQCCKRARLELVRRLLPDSSGTGSGRSASRVTDSVRARAARSASLNQGVSRHAATAKMRSSLSPAFLSSRACMSTHTLQPLIWLARSCTSFAVTYGSPSADASSACSAFKASGRSSTGCFILACIVVSPIGRSRAPGFIPVTSVGSAPSPE